MRSSAPLADWHHDDDTVTDRIVPSMEARAVGRFRPDGLIGYRPASRPDLLFPTRAEAVAAERAEQEKRRTAARQALDGESV